MKEMHQSQFRFVIMLAFLIIVVTKVNCQTTIPDVLLKNSLHEQMNYIEERTKIYENYRAIREDMFQLLKKNIADTVYEDIKNINDLNAKTIILNRTIDSLNTRLQTVQSRLEETTLTKNSLKVFGMEVNKTIYNLIMWAILVVLAGSLIIGFMAFKQNISLTNNTREEIMELKKEFEAYRKTSREAREKMSMDHFKEIKKLKGTK
jgi:hypothetical protein